MNNNELQALQRTVRRLENERLSLRSTAAELYRRANAIEQLEKDIRLIMKDEADQIVEDKPRERGVCMGAPLRVLDLCSGIGGFTLAHEMTGGFETVAFCEQDEFCQRVLRNHWPDVPIFDDIKKLRGDDIGTADVICGGIPCQPFSVAGQRKGEADDRHLWPEFLRLTKELRPDWCIIENVAGFVPMALDGVLSDLEGLGYATGAYVVPACAVDAAHRRDRVWALAYCASNGMEKPKRENRKPDSGGGGQSGMDALRKRGDVGNADRARQLQPGGHQFEERGRFGDASAWSDSQWLDCADGKARRVKSGVRLLANGVPKRVDKLRALGNAIVPQVAARFFYVIGESV